MPQLFSNGDTESRHLLEPRFPPLYSEDSSGFLEAVSCVQWDTTGRGELGGWHPVFHKRQLFMKQSRM